MSLQTVVFSESKMSSTDGDHVCIPNRRQKVRRCQETGPEMTNTLKSLWKSAFRCLLQLSQWSDVAASIRRGKNLLFTESILAKLVSSLSFCMARYHPTFWIMLTWTQTLINFEGTSDFDHPAQHFSSTSWAAALLSWKQRFSKITCIYLFWKLWFENNLSKPMHQKESTTRLWEASNSCQSKHNQAV